VTGPQKCGRCAFAHITHFLGVRRIGRFSGRRRERGPKGRRGFSICCAPQGRRAAARRPGCFGTGAGTGEEGAATVGTSPVQFRAPLGPNRCRAKFRFFPNGYFPRDAPGQHPMRAAAMGKKKKLDRILVRNRRLRWTSRGFGKFPGHQKKPFSARRAGA